MTKEFITMKEAAEMLGVGYSTLQREAAKKGCPLVRRTPRGPIYFNPDKLKAWWEKSSVV
jgi:excisionase family DNA binding protein